MLKRLTVYFLALAICLAPLGCVSDDDDDDSAAPAGFPDSLKTAETFAVEWVDDDPTMIWSWGEFVMLYGFWRVYSVGGDEAIADYVGTFFEEKSDQYAPIASDWLSPAALGILLCEQTGEEKYCGALETFDDYFVTVKRENDALVHWTGPADESTGNDREVWVDTLFMAGTYMIERGRTTGDPKWYDDLATQYIRFDEILNDGDTNLLNHGYDFETEQFINGDGVLWARGNSWYIASLGNFLGVLPADYPQRATMEALWKKRAEPIIAIQRPDGLWDTLLGYDDPLNYPEASASALFAYGLIAGINAGLALDGAAEAARKTYQALNDSIIDGGARLELPNISIGTNPGSADYYLEVPVRENVTWGLGAYCLLAVEIARADGEIKK